MIVSSRALEFSVNLLVPNGNVWVVEVGMVGSGSLIINGSQSDTSLGALRKFVEGVNHGITRTEKNIRRSKLKK